jgi:hypothetical protein
MWFSEKEGTGVGDAFSACQRDFTPLRSEPTLTWVRLSSLRYNGFNGHELRAIDRIIRDNQQALLEAWNGWFGN